MEAMGLCYSRHLISLNHTVEMQHPNITMPLVSTFSVSATQVYDKMHNGITDRH